jgi:Ni,Fe-hydrogenase III large subunit/Ni,Fe-hydrogenase III component G
MTGQELIDRLRSRFKQAVGEVREPVAGKFYVAASRGSLDRISDFLVNTLGARYVVSAGSDLRPRKGYFEVAHFFSFDTDHLYVTLQTSVTNPKVPSITPTVPAANWAEREFRDVVGVVPTGHPDPRRLVLADDWPADVHPLRKDFPYDYKPPSDGSAAPEFKAPPEGTTVIPVGPFYPVLEEPCHIRLFVDGEAIVDCDYRGFYNHRGIEKLGDSVLTYNQIPFIAERICGICGFVHSCCYCQAVEEAAGIEVPIRAKYIRSIMLELERVHSHLLWLGIAGHIIGFDTVLMQSWRIREPVMWLSEKITGNRKNYGMNLIGGVRRDIPKEVHQEILDVLGKIESESKALVAAIPGDTTLTMRLKGIGVLTEEDARKFAVVGPTARGSNVPIDSRKDHPYAAYDLLDFKVAVYDGCDILARTLVRMDELFESIKIIRLALAEMPDGPIMAQVDEEIPAGLEGLCSVEAPRGEAFHYVMTGEDNKPERWRVRAPTYANLQALPTIIQDETIADVPISLGSMDPCFSCTERVEVADVRTGQVKIFSQDDLLALSRGSQGR